MPIVHGARDVLTQLLLEDLMPKVVLVALLIAVASFAAVKLTSISTSSSVLARSAAANGMAEPSMNPNALMRTAPRDLPTENWNPI